jgi:hypothetical protein
MCDRESDAAGELTTTGKWTASTRAATTELRCVHGFEATVKRQRHVATECLVSTADQAICEVGFALLVIRESQFDGCLIFDHELPGEDNSLHRGNDFLPGMAIRQCDTNAWTWPSEAFPADFLNAEDNYRSVS